MNFQEAFVEMHIHAAFLVDNDTGLLVTGFQEALECLLKCVYMLLFLLIIPCELSRGLC